jgi:hypothetical protein
MAAKTTLACDEEVEKTGETSSKRVFDVTEDNASDAAEKEAEDEARAAMSKAIGKIKNKYVCDDEDCPRMVVKRHLDTEITCREASRRDPDTGAVENGYKCKAACTWTVTVECEKSK